jgi:asparagine synthase (glutamine-hydrolysing)
MFAITIWDNELKKIVIARDRYGMKPLYYYCDGKNLIFASEIKSILKSKLYRKELDYYGLCEYLTFQNYISDKTLFKNILLLAQGTIMEFNPELEPSSETYWDFNFFNKNSLIKDSGKDLNSYIKNAVKRQSYADVDINSYLSGGIDSASIVYNAKKFIKNLKTFTIGFDLSSASGIELFFDERKKAERISSIFKTNHYENILKSGDLEKCIDDLVYHVEEPRVGQSYPNLYASMLARKFGKVVFSGVGADELFGGYPWRYIYLKKKVLFEDFLKIYFKKWKRLSGNELLNPKSSLISHKEAEEYKYENFKKIFDSYKQKYVTPNDALNYCMYFEAKTFLNGLLLVEDKISMSKGLEVRAPFLDNDLVNYALKIPNKKLFLKTKLNNNENNLRAKYKQFIKGKLILRKSLSKSLPRDILYDRKQGFSGPDKSWFRGESIDFINSQLKNLPNFLNKKKVLEIFKKHIGGKQNYRLTIWSIIYLIKFSKIFKIR